MSNSISELLQSRNGDNFALHNQYLNPQMVKVLKTIGYDRIYTHAKGQYIYDSQGDEYLDLLSGFGVFAIGRNHPTVTTAIQDVLEAELPDMVQMDVSLLSGLLSEKIVSYCPGDINRMFFLQFWCRSSRSCD